ncbi:hypothetical protein PR048_024313, partial [Dryococelus australis]
MSCHKNRMTISFREIAEEEVVNSIYVTHSLMPYAAPSAMMCVDTSFHDFVNHACMTEIKERSVFIHIDVPGHEDNASNLPDSFQFPSLQVLGEELIKVVEFLNVKYVIGLGEGAGANVLARFGLAHPSHVLGLILINCTGSAASVLEGFKNK